MPNKVVTPEELSARVVLADKGHVWHPYTRMDEYIATATPLVVTHARGSRFFDAAGKSYLDGNASWWVAVLGHNHPRLVARLKEQASQMCHVPLAGIAHEQAALLAEELVGILPVGLTRVFYNDDGTTAVECALKLALQYWAQNGRPERKRLIALEGAFHGESLGATSIGGVEVFRRPFAGALLDCIRVPPGDAGHGAAFALLGKLLDEAEDSIAAVIVEPLLQGAGGMRVYAAEYLRFLREQCSAHDTFLICDEVFSGYGRTGAMWASETAQVSPDIMCVAKGFTAGILPMAATLTTERIFRGFLGGAERAFYHGHSYCGHPLGAAVAREVLAIYRDEDILGQAASKAQKIANFVAELGTLPHVFGARSIGMMGAATLGEEPGSGPQAAAAQAGYLSQLGWRVYAEALARGAYLRPLGNVVYTTPALNISDADLDELLSIFFDSVRAAMKVV